MSNKLTGSEYCKLIKRTVLEKQKCNDLRYGQAMVIVLSQDFPKTYLCYTDLVSETYNNDQWEQIDLCKVCNFVFTNLVEK